MAACLTGCAHTHHHSYVPVEGHETAYAVGVVLGLVVVGVAIATGKPLPKVDEAPKAAQPPAGLHLSF